MKYQGSFRSIQRNKLYRVEIITDNDDSSTQDISLGYTPFTTNMDESGATMYTPVKYQSAEIQIVGNTYLFDLYSSTAKQNKVKLYDASNGNAVKFTGYTTPNTYSAPYDFETETYTVEALDGLSVLQYYDYTPVSGTKDFVTFANILKHILSTSGCYNYFYFTKSIVIENRSDSIANLYISEQNFFDEEDKPMKMRDVLEEICKFMNVTCVAHGEDVYFMNYDAINSGINTYWRYEISGSTIGNVTLSDSKNVVASSYTGTGAQLTLDNTYSKVTVRDSLYQVGSIIPSLFEDEDLINVYAVSDSSQNWLRDNVLSCYDKGSSNKSSDDTHFSIRYRYYENKKFIHTYYNNSGTWQGDSSSNIYPYNRSYVIRNAVDAENKQGLIFARYNIGQGKTSQDAYNAVEINGFTNYLMIPINRVPVSVESIVGQTVNYKKRLESRAAFDRPFFLSGNAKLIAKGSLILTDRYTFPTTDNSNGANVGYFPNTGPFLGDYTGWGPFGDQLALPKGRLKLHIGLDTGSGEITNYIPFFPEGGDSTYLYEKGSMFGGNSKHEIFYNSFDVQDNVTYNDNIEEQGYKLNTGLASTDVIGMKSRIKIYGFDSLLETYSTMGQCPYACAFIKDFDIVGAMPAQNGNVSVEDINSTDTEYSYVINNEYVNSLSTIDFKICTWDDKQLNYSAVAYKPSSGNSYRFLDKLTDSGLNATARAEHLLCYRIVNQYTNPCKKLTLNLFNDYLPYTRVLEKFLNKYMIIDSMNIDYVFDRAEVHLIEKK